MNEVQLRAKSRLDAIEQNRARINEKIAVMTEDSRVPAWEKRLAEYDLSEDAIKLELRTGKPMRIGGTVVQVPTGAVKLEGGK